MSDVKVKPVDVAVGILMKPNGDVLLGQRPAASRMTAIGSFLAAKSNRAKPFLMP